jgi:glycolate oxidase subunit GlcD
MVITKEQIAELESMLGEKAVLTSSDDLKTYGTDWTKEFEPDPSVVLLPQNKEQVSDILKFCQKRDISVVPSGGRTGLAGACVAAKKEVVLSLEKLNSIVKVDKVGLTMTVEAGVTTQKIQEVAKEHDLFFSLDLAAKGSCQIGGNVATNAGGLKLIKYGGTREQVLGLQAVLMDGSFLDMGRALRKDNTGYDLKQLFIGSEGTLGVVTEVTVKLSPIPESLHLSVLAVPSFDIVAKILEYCNTLGISPTAFEFFTEEALKVVLKGHPSLSRPFETQSPYYLLLELEEGSKGCRPNMETFVEELFEVGLIEDAVFSTNSSEFQTLWGLRENISEAVSASAHLKKNDISVPVDSLANYLNKMNEILGAFTGDIEVILFGHIGDGNIHINYCGSNKLRPEEFVAQCLGLEGQFFAELKKIGGSISAEHGIGLLKKKDLALAVDEATLQIMRSIKAVFDPKGLLNPGKIF